MEIYIWDKILEVSLTWFLYYFDAANTFYSLNVENVDEDDEGSDIENCKDSLVIPVRLSLMNRLHEEHSFLWRGTLIRLGA